MWGWPQRLQRQVLLLIALVLSGTVLSYGWITTRGQTAHLEAALEAQSAVLARTLAEACAHHLLVRDYAGLEDFLLQMARLPEVRRIQVHERTGQPLLDIPRAPGGAPARQRGSALPALPPASHSSQERSGTRLTVREPIQAGHLLGWVSLDTDRQAIAELQGETWRNAGLLAGVWILGGGLLLLALLRPSVRAIEALTAFARGLDQAKGAASPPVRGAQEITALGAALTAASRELRATEDALREAGDLVTALTESSPDAIFVKDCDGRYRLANPATCHHLGRERAAILGRDDRELLPPEAARWIMAADRDVLARGTVQTGEETLWLAGQARTFLYVKGPLVDGGGILRGLFGIARDITDRKAAEVALAGYAHQLEVIRQVAAEILRELDRDRGLTLILERATALVRASGGVIHLWDEATGALHPQTRFGAAFTRLPRRPLPLGEGLIGQVAAAKQGCVVNDYRAWPAARPDTLAHTRVTAALAEPLLVADRLVGVINLVHEDGGGTFSAADQALLRLFAQQAAIAIENARLFAAAQRERQEADLLATLAHRVSGSLELDATLQAIVAGARELGEADLARLALRTDTGSAAAYTFRYWAGEIRGAYDGIAIRPGQGLGGHVLQTGQPARTAAHRDDPAVDQSFAALAAAEGIRAECVVPLTVGGQIEGLLYLDRRTARPFTDREEQLLVRLADHAALALANARLHAATRTQAGQLAALAAATQAVTSTLELAQATQAILAAVPRLLPEAAARLWQAVPGQPGVLQVTAQVGLRTAAPSARTTVRAGEGLSGLAIQTRHPVVSAALATDPRHLNRAWAAAEGFVSACVVPLLRGEACLGTLVVLTRTPHAFPPDEIAVFQALAAHAAIGLETARLFAELNQAFADLQAAQAALLQGEKLRALGQLAGGVAHTLNNKLFVILGNLALLESEGPGPPAEGIGLLRAAAEEAALVVRQLQAFTRQRSGRGAPGPVDLHTLVQDVVALTRPQWKDGPEAAGAPIALRVEPPPLPAVPGDAPALQEALTHLVLNACEAMPAGGTLTLAGATDPAGAWVDLTVSDTGVGMPPAVQAKLFEPFFTTKGVQRRGLGLATAYGIVERHGGRLSATSTPGAGTTMRLRLPTAGPPGPPPPGPARRVLVVDDEPAVRATTAALLRAAGHAVTEVESGPAALAALATAPPEVVVTDLGMPDMNGWALARRIRDTHPGLPVVLLTGWGEQAAGDAADRGRVQAILRKPVPPPELLRTIARVLEDRGAEARVSGGRQGEDASGAAGRRSPQA